METFSALLAICAGNSPVPVNSPHKGQWRRALMLSLICVWINGWVNNREAGDLRRHRAHYDVIVMMTSSNGNIFRVTGPLCGEFTGHRSPVNSPHRGQWRGALMFSLICVWINAWVNNHEAGDLRHHRCHDDVTVMKPRHHQSRHWYSSPENSGFSTIRENVTRTKIMDTHHFMTLTIYDWIWLIDTNIQQQIHTNLCQFPWTVSLKFRHK